jgi:hypothetical protein
MCFVDPWVGGVDAFIGLLGVQRSMLHASFAFTDPRASEYKKAGEAPR